MKQEVHLFRSERQGRELPRLFPPKREVRITFERRDPALESRIKEHRGTFERVYGKQQFTLGPSWREIDRTLSERERREKSGFEISAKTVDDFVSDAIDTSVAVRVYSKTGNISDAIMTAKPNFLTKHLDGKVVQTPITKNLSRFASKFSIAAQVGSALGGVGGRLWHGEPWRIALYGGVRYTVTTHVADETTVARFERKLEIGNSYSVLDTLDYSPENFWRGLESALTFHDPQTGLSFRFY